MKPWENEETERGKVSEEITEQWYLQKVNLSPKDGDSLQMPLSLKEAM